ncbi:MAG: UDP-2,4-diacetamido-2,4,6-trideoxy-beta-L-altropyranose hydrolase [Myxococcales bacterium]|nr:UDP-2,4-diacetamido-2,4,6-trideoxy-beta-L-altropyranose hydrolase [Myxococcales bacterium]
MAGKRPILFRCNASPVMGLGHFVRSLALAEEFLARGVPVDFVSRFHGLEWPAEQLRQRRIPRHEPKTDDAAWLVDYARRRKAAAVVVDWYLPDADYFAQLAGHGFVVAALDDQAARPLPVDVLINQNFGAEELTYRTRPDTTRLLGREYALIRRNVLQLRDQARQRRFATRATKVLVTIGGTDPKGLTQLVLDGLIAGGQALEIHAILPNREQYHAIGAMRPAPNQRLVALRPVDNMAEHFLWCDLAVSGAGSTCWELAHLATPMALLQVADNQAIIYRRLTEVGAAVGLGLGDEVEPAKLTPVLEDLLGNRLWRSGLSVKAADLVDGLGSRRVADAILERAAAAAE